MGANLTKFVFEIEIAGGLALALAVAWLSLGRSPHRSAPSGQVGGAEDGPDSRVKKYHPLHVIIHWFVVFAMAQLLTRGALIMVNVANDNPQKLDALKAHGFAGILVFVLMLGRLVLLRTTFLPLPARAPALSLDRLKRLVHPMLYVSVFIQVASGLGMALQADLPRILLLHEGTLPATFWIYPLRSVHYLNSRLLMGLIGLHLAGALYHALVMRDGLLRRMTFGNRFGHRQTGKSDGTILPVNR
ncbi:MAG TPA: cytochrome b/b6 domain-containing protein [Micropepsaceae bacterium]|nr:cytochrome b/b6 domain-containing protein [Micropepsaceae bacterium]